MYTGAIPLRRPPGCVMQRGGRNTLGLLLLVFIRFIKITIVVGNERQYARQIGASVECCGRMDRGAFVLLFVFSLWYSLHQVIRGSARKGNTNHHILDAIAGVVAQGEDRGQWAGFLIVTRPTRDDITKSA